MPEAGCQSAAKVTSAAPGPVPGETTDSLWLTALAHNPEANGREAHLSGVTLSDYPPLNPQPFITPRIHGYRPRPSSAGAVDGSPPSLPRCPVWHGRSRQPRSGLHVARGGGAPLGIWPFGTTPPVIPCIHAARSEVCDAVHVAIQIVLLRDHQPRGVRRDIDALVLDPVIRNLRPRNRRGRGDPGDVDACRNRRQGIRIVVRSIACDVVSDDLVVVQI